MKKREAFGYIDALGAIALLMIAATLIFSTINIYYKNIYWTRENHRLDNIINDEIIMIKENKIYMDKEVGDFIIKYEYLGTVYYQGLAVKNVKMELSNRAGNIKKEYKIAFR